MNDMLKEKKALYDLLCDVRSNYDKKLAEIDREMNEVGRQSTYIVIKKINGNKYYYEQWREGEKIKSRSLGKVIPGAVSEHEQRIVRRMELFRKRLYLTQLRDKVSSQCDELGKEIKKEEWNVDLEDYSFEVFYKNDISARVAVKNNRVHVNRYIIHPVRQLFPGDNISRNTLNEIFRLRCFDENRPDAMDKLRYLGLNEYNPREIVRRTHGVSYNDYLWFRFEGENLCAEDVLVRDEYVRRNNK